MSKSKSHETRNTPAIPHDKHEQILFWITQILLEGSEFDEKGLLDEMQLKKLLLFAYSLIYAIKNYSKGKECEQ